MPNIIKASEMSMDNSNIRAIIYGGAGSGKTQLYASFPKPMCVFDWDKKYKPLIGIEGIDIISYAPADLSDAPKQFLQFKRDWKEIKNGGQYRTIVLDSITSFDTVNLKYFCSISKGGLESTPTLPVYQDQGSYYAFFFAELKSIAAHVVITAHEHFNEDEQSGVMSIQPLITGKQILRKLPSMFEEVWYLERKAADKAANTPEQYILHWKPWKKAIATSTFLRGTGELILPEANGYDAIIKEGHKVVR